MSAVRGRKSSSDAKVLVIGAGGLGAPVIQYLAAAGVGTIGIADDDVVSLSNLQRQVIHGTDDVGKPKTASAAAAVTGSIRMCGWWSILRDSRQSARTARNYDIVADGSDNFDTRYAVSDACATGEKTAGDGGGERVRRLGDHLASVRARRRTERPTRPIAACSPSRRRPG
jgi:molybdopterin/thiamine biosynthesis adenylyltransferase